MSIFAAFKDFTETSALETGDAIPLQRGGKNFYVVAENLGGGLLKATYELSTSELEDLNTTPIEIIPAQGANTYIMVMGAMAFRNGTAFTAGDAVMKILFSSRTQAYWKTAAAFLTTVGATLTQQMTPDGSGTTLYANEGISAYLTQDVTTATGTVTIEIIYRVMTLA